MTLTLATKLEDSRTYTLGDWLVATGATTEFIRKWRHLSEWLSEFPGTESLVLMQDIRDPAHFVSLGAWSEGGTSAPWPEFLESLGKCRALCKSCQGRTYRLAAGPSQAIRGQPADLVA